MENQGDVEDVSEILYSQNEADVTNLINSVESDNVLFGSSLTKLNNKLSGNKYRPKRKELNTFLVECLVKTESTYPLALIWLKQRVAFETCDTVISDYNYINTKIQNAKEKC